MTDLTGTPTYQEFVRQLETTDPTHPDTWNPNYQTLINNDAYLKQEIEANDQDISDLQGELDALGTSDPVEIKTAVNLDWLYRDNRIAFELFSSTYTLRDLLDPVGGVETVQGDDSVDIADTSGLETGNQYVIYDGTHIVAVEVAEVFSSTRFRAKQALSATMSDANLASTSFDLSGSKAAAGADDIYFAHRVNLDNSEDAAAVIRHNGSAGDLRLYFRDNDHPDWTEAPWKWQRDVDGLVDVEYLLKARGYFDLKLVAQTDGLEVHHLVCVVAETGLEGTHNAPAQPENQSPADGATEIQETPTLSGSSYDSPVDSDQYAKQVQVATSADGFDADEGFADTDLIHDSGARPAGTSYSVPRGELAESQEYHWSIRYQDMEGAWSKWSTPFSFTTAAAFEYVVTPQNQSPEDGATDIPESPTLSTRDFETDGFEGTDLNDGSTDLWTESTATAGEYYYTGSALGGRPSAVFANDSKLSEREDPGALSEGEWAWRDNDSLGAATVYVKIAAGDPDAQTAGYVQAGEVHLASQWRIRQSGGSYDTPVYDSGEVADLTSHQVPAGNLEEGETSYYFQARHQGENIGWSDWSSETGFTTKEQFAQIFGIALESTGGGAGTWQQIDEDGNNVFLSSSDFANHPVWGNIEDVVIDGQDMVKIPKFYAKTGIAPTGSDQAGNKCWWVSDEAVGGFSVHPAFMDGGIEIDQVYVGKYEGIDDGTNGSAAAIVGSASGAAPLVSTTFADYKQYCANRNEANGGNTGVEGFHLWTVYELAAVQLLALIELNTSDAQAAIADGNVNSSSADNTGTTNAVWRGIYELWGNVRHWTDGLQLDGSHQVQIWDINGNQSLVSTGVNTTSSDGWGVTLHDESGSDWDLSLIFLPKTTDSTESNGTLADYLYASDSGEQNVCNHGGDWGLGSRAGLFCLRLTNEVSNSSTYVGGRLAKW
jgi:hypothetical protein